MSKKKTEMKIKYSESELKKMLKHAEEQHEISETPEDVKNWRERIALLKDRIKNREELRSWR